MSNEIVEQTDFDDSIHHFVISTVPNRWMVAIVDSTNSYCFCISTMGPLYTAREKEMDRKKEM